MLPVAIDDGTIPNGWGSININDEGTPAQRKVLIEKGTLTTLLHNLKTAAKAGVKSTGNASKASYAAMVGISPFTFPVKSFTVSGNFFELLKKIEKVGADLEFIRGKWGSPSVLVRDMAIAGK